MKKVLIRFILMMVMLGSLSACSSGISNAQLQKDILALPEFSLAIKVRDLAIIEKLQSNETNEYKLSVSLHSFNYDLSADVTLNYTKSDGKWVVSNHTVDIIKVQPLNEPVLTDLLNKELRHFSGGIVNNYEIGITDSNYSVTSSTTDLQNGKATLHVSENFSNDFYSVEAQFSISAIYLIDAGWTYEVTDWTYHDVMKWSGTYSVVWNNEEPGYPSGDTNTFFNPGDKITDIKITGEASMTKAMNKETVISNTLESSFTFKEIEYRITPRIGKLNTLTISIEPTSDTNSQMNLTYYPKAPVDGYVPYDIVSRYMVGQTKKLP